MMTLLDYNKMDNRARIDEVSRNAVYLAQRTVGYYDICLYQLYGFYIEAYFSYGVQPEHEVRVFSDTRLFNAYINKIDISGLFPGV